MFSHFSDGISVNLILATVSLGAFAGLVIAAALNDLVSYKIPNKICLAILLIWPVFALSAPGDMDWVGGLVAGGLALVAGMVLFAVRAWGAGDAKLLTVLSLWAGTGMALDFLFVTAIAGGVFAVLMLGGFLRPVAFFLAGHGHSAGADMIESRQMPYGLALAAGGLFVAWRLFAGV